MRRHKITILSLSVFLFLLQLLVSITGLITEDFYARETANWQAQSIGQDWVDLFVVSPVLIISSFLMYQGKSFAKALWAGCIFYLTYTFTIYCFDVQFNQLFLLYCVVLGLSFYLSLYFLYDGLTEQKLLTVSPRARRVVGSYFIFISIVFYWLWLSDIIPAIAQEKVPDVVLKAGLPTNAVHVIDLAIFLPAVLVAGFTLLKNHMLANLLAAPLLVFFALMDITISVLTYRMYAKGFEVNMAVIWVMILMVFVNIALFVFYQRSIQLHISHERLSKDIYAVPAAV